MPKAVKKCNQCAICTVYGDFGLCRCFGKVNITGLQNRACKMFLPKPKACEQHKQPIESRLTVILEHGKAPFCGDFNKCNNAEGCDTCREFEEWAEANEGLNE